MTYTEELSVICDPNGGDCALVDRGRHIVGEAYALVDVDETRPAEQNARLWALAPLMLEALQAEQEANMLFDEFFSNKGLPSQEREEIRSKARHARAKATTLREQVLELAEKRLA